MIDREVYLLPEEELLLRGPLGRRLRLPDEEPPGLLEDLGPPLRERLPPPLGRLPLGGSPRLLPPRPGGPLGRRLL